MAEKSEVGNNRILNRICDSLAVSKDGGISAFFVKIVGIIDDFVDMMGDQMEKDKADIARGLALLWADILDSLSVETPGGASEIAYKVQSVVDFWIEIVGDQAVMDCTSIKKGLKSGRKAVAASFAVDRPGGVSELASKGVAVADKGVNIIGDNLVFQSARMKAGFVNFCQRTWEYRAQVLKYVAGLTLICICMMAGMNYSTGYSYSYNGRDMGLVKNQEDVTKVLSVASMGLTAEYGVDVQIDPVEDFKFKKVVVLGNTVDTSDDVLKKLTYMQDMKVSACSIFVDGVKAATVDTEETANKVLEQVKAKYINAEKADKYLDTKFKEDVEIKTVNTTVGKLMSVNTASKLLSSGEKNLKYTVQMGDTVDSISETYGMNRDKFFEVNRDIDEKQGSIKEGKVISVVNSTPKLTVSYAKMKTYYKTIEYKEERVETESLYEGDSQVQNDGYNGKTKYTAKVFYEDGNEVSRDIVEKEVVSEPVNKVVLVGTKKRPATVGSGNLINPCPAGYQSSGFGQRWGRLHRGVDLACGAGNNIYAADGGTVIVAGYNGSYGNYVKINHQNGMVTTYAHASALCVSVGDKVYQGQVIAKVGNTGNSFGAHCHFEVEVNGVLQNPRGYF